MRVLIVGGGGRESALVWQCRRSPLLHQLYVTPGNASLQAQATCVDLDISTLPAFARANDIDLVICGP